MEEVGAHFAQIFRKHPPILPVYSIVDRRRALHRAALDQPPDWSAIPMASQIEPVAVRRAPLGSFDRASPSSQAVPALWAGIERKLAEAPARQ